MASYSRRWFPTLVLTAVAALAIPLAGRCRAQQATPVAERLWQLIEVLNSADADRAEEFIENIYAPDFRDAFPMVRHMAMFTSLSTNWGEIVLDRMEENDPTSLEALARNVAGDRWLRITISVESEEPHRIDRLMFEPASAPEPMVAGGLDADSVSTWAELDTWLRARTAADAFSGTVLVARSGEIIFEHAYGLASKTYQVENRMDTRFNLGSLSKLFTSVAIAQLAQQGRLRFDDPIGEYLSDFPVEAATKVTIRHLLQMRSGWGDYWDHEVFLARRTELRTVADYIAFLKDMPLQFEPGTEQIHSNTSFMVLGAIIEAVTGQDYFSYVREHIFAPAGMRDSDPWAARDAPGQNIATGYTNQNPYDTRNSGYRWSNIYYIATTGTPAGGGYSSAPDMLAFTEALRTHRLLNEEYTEIFYRRFDPGMSGAVLLFAGGTMGANTVLTLDVQDGYEIIVLSNYDVPVAMDVARAVRRILATG